MGNKKAEVTLLNVLLLFLLIFSSAGDTAVVLKDRDGDSIVSEGGRFELGFFTPHGRSDARRYAEYGTTA